MLFASIKLSKYFLLSVINGKKGGDEALASSPKKN